jgi:glycogen operon protein
MILGGDEFMRSQHGNNNAYCQDNEISWFDWTAVSRNRTMVTFFRKAIAFTRRYPVLQRRKFFLGTDLDDDRVPDLTWFSPDLGRPAWHDPNVRTLCYQLDASEERGDVKGTRLFFILNAHFDAQWVTLPSLEVRQRWYRVIDTSLPSGEDFMEPGQEVRLDPQDHYLASPRSTVILLGR